MVDGLWDATIAAAGATIPFRFEIATSGTSARRLLLRRRPEDRIDGGTFADGALTLDYDFLNTTLELKR